MKKQLLQWKSITYKYFESNDVRQVKIWPSIPMGSLKKVGVGKRAWYTLFVHAPKSPQIWGILQTPVNFSIAQIIEDRLHVHGIGNCSRVPIAAIQNL